MIVLSKLGGAVNDYIKTITDINIKFYPKTEIIEILSDVKDIYIDTAKGISSSSLAGLKQAKHKYDYGYYGARETVTVPLEGRKNNTRIALGTLIGIAWYLYKNKNKPFSCFIGNSVNHIDMTGNRAHRGFTNNRLYNLEYCTTSQNSVHYYVIKKLEEIYDRKQFAVSALDDELIELIRFNDGITLKNKLDEYAMNAEVDDNGTIYLGKAAEELRHWKEIWDKQLMEIELKGVRLRQCLNRK